jgi:hypothetical protein
MHRNLRRRLSAVAVALLVLFLPMAATADIVTGNYSGGGSGGGSTVQDNTTIPISALMTAPTAGSRSWVDFTPLTGEIFTFGELTSLSATFHSIDGSSGDGFPCLTVLLDDTNTNKDALLYIYLGNANYDTGINGWSDQNVIGNPDLGRYRMSTSGEPIVQTYADALAAYGDMTVLQFAFVVGMGNQPLSAPRSVNLYSINATYSPEPASFVLAGTAIAGLIFLRKRASARR